MTTQTGNQTDRQQDWRKRTIWTVVFGLLTLGVGSAAIDHPGNQLAKTFLLVVGLAILLGYTLAPTIIAIRAMRAARRTIHTQNDEPLQIGQLVRDALYGSRDLVQLTVGTMPFLVFGIFYIVVYINTIFANSMGCVGDYDQERFGCFLWPSPSNAELINALLSLTALSVAFWGLALLGATLGVGLALRKWYTTLLTIVLLIVLLLVSVGLALLLLQAPPHAQSVRMTFPPDQSGKGVYMQGQTRAENLPAVDPGLLPQSIAIMILPFAVAAGVMVLSRRYLPGHSAKGTT